MTPVQRVVQYKLHIADLLKNTHPQDPVLPSIKDAHAAAASFASFVDSVVDLQKGLEQLLSIPMKVKGCPVHISLPWVLSFAYRAHLPREAAAAS